METIEINQEIIDDVTCRNLQLPQIPLAHIFIKCTALAAFFVCIPKNSKHKFCGFLIMYLMSRNR